MTTGPDPVSVEPCPRCGAAIGEPCRTPSGKKAKHVHRERFEAVYPPGSFDEEAEEITAARMTDQQVRDTVAGLRMREDERAVLLRRALAGEPEARFAVAAMKLAQEREKKEQLEPNTGGDHA